MTKTKIVFDTDVLIHFSTENYLSILPQIFPEYECIILSKVYNEAKSIRKEIDNICNYLKTLKVIDFAPKGNMLLEYAKLKNRFGDGESACMAYCKYNHDVVGSSNLRDIKQYCSDNQITYLTTLDFFYYAWKRGKLKEVDIDKAIDHLRANGHRLPPTKIGQYRPNISL